MQKTEEVVQHEFAGVRTGKASPALVENILVEAYEGSQMRLRELAAVGVDPLMLPVGAAALDGLAAMVPALAEGGPYLIIEVEESNTELCVMEAGVCTYARSLAMGQDELAEPTRRLQVLGAFKRSLGAYRASGGRPLERAFLAGEGVRHLHALETFFSEQILDGLVVESLPMPMAEGTDELSRPRFARAAGLAGHAVVKGKRIDLRKGEFAKSRSLGLFRQHGRLLAVCAAVVFVSFVFATWARWSVLEAEQEELQTRLATVTGELFDEETRSATHPSVPYVASVRRFLGSAGESTSGGNTAPAE